MFSTLVMGALSLPGLSFAQGITVQPGASFNVAGGAVSLGCGDLLVGGDLTVSDGSLSTVLDVGIPGGSFSLGAGSIALSGNWFNSGAFNAGTGSVNIVDGCARTSSVMSGNTTFYAFNVTTTAGRQLQVEAGSTQIFQRDLSLLGTLANPLRIRSTSPGTAARFTLLDGASQSINGVDVAYNDASGGQTIAPGEPSAFDSIDSGSATNWFTNLIIPGLPGQPITTLPAAGLALLALLLALLAHRNQITPYKRRISL